MRFVEGTWNWLNYIKKFNQWGLKPQPNHPATIFWGVTVSFPQDLNTDWLVTQLGDQPPHSQWICLKPQRCFFYQCWKRRDNVEASRSPIVQTDAKPKITRLVSSSDAEPKITSLESCSFLDARHIKSIFQQVLRSWMALEARGWFWQIWVPCT